MNELNFSFSDLYKKIKTIAETAPASQELSGNDELLVGEKELDECGEMPIGPMSSSKQQDNVTMNVSMNGSGAGGIRDLMSILKNIEQGAGDNSNKDVIVGMGEEQVDGDFQSATTEPSEQVFGIDAMTRTGDDLSSKGKEAPKMNGGGNPMQETLLRRLSAHYNEVKAR